MSAPNQTSERRGFSGCEGSAQLITATGHVPIPLEPTTTGRDVLKDIERAHSWKSPIVLKPLEAAPVATLRVKATKRPKPRPPRPEKPAAAVPAPPERLQHLVDAQPPAPPRVPRPRRRSPAARHGLDVQAVVEAYTAGETIPSIARRMSSMPATVRRVLRREGVELRDDRAGHSGSQPNTSASYDVAFLQRLGELYLLEGLTQEQCAAELGVTTKVVYTAMKRCGIPTRPPAHLRRAAS